MKAFNKFTSKILLSCLCMFGVSTSTLTAKPNSKNKDYIDKFCSDINELKDDDIKIPEYIFNNAKGAIVLNNTKASFIIGVGGTEGVGFKKIGNSWGPVAFYSGPGMSLGIQIGASNNSIIMMLMNDEGLKLLQGKNAKFSGDLKATAGPTLIDESTKDNSDVYVYSTGTGLEVGASIGVEKLTVNYKKMKQYYDNKNLSEEDLNAILDGKNDTATKISTEKTKEFFDKLNTLKDIKNNDNK